MVRNVDARQSLSFIALVQQIIFFVKIITDLFHYGHRVGGFNRMLAHVNEFLKKLIGIGHIEVAG
ncbi:hypothetical protein DSECCO2_540200 [anaerobic digester metagenome]